MKKLSNEFMENILNDSAWKELSGDFQWTEQMLEKYKTKVDWKEISTNRNIVWTPAMLEKFKNSSTGRSFQAQSAKPSSQGTLLNSIKTTGIGQSCLKIHASK